MKLVLVDCPQDVTTATTALIEAFGRGPAPKDELSGTEVVSLSHAELGKRKIPALDDVGAVVTMGHEAFLSVVEWLNKGAALRGVVAMVEEYDARSIDRILKAAYPGLVGVTRRRVVTDPEELGSFATLLKRALRVCQPVATAMKPKKLGWKIQAQGHDFIERRLVSLFLDSRMREFMQRLAFACRSVANNRIGPPPKSYEDLVQAFSNLGRTLKDNGLGDKLRNCKNTLNGYLEPKDSVRPPAILLEGETGVGKSLSANWIASQLTPRQPPVQIPLVNVSKDLLEAELFGTLSGGWTDAVSRPGQLNLAWGKVVLLDEIGDAPPEIQAKLLVYLDTCRMRPNGWPFLEEIYSPCYIVAATNRNLDAMVQAGTFREDLYHRFRYRLRVPPLRERLGDMRLLIDFTLQDPSVNPAKEGGRAARQSVEQPVTSIHVEALEKLEAYAFPGNYRELEDVLSRAVFRATLQGRSDIQAQDIAIATE